MKNPLFRHVAVFTVGGLLLLGVGGASAAFLGQSSPPIPPIPTNIPTRVPTTIPKVPKQPGYTKKTKKVILSIRTDGFQSVHWLDEPNLQDGCVSASKGTEDLAWGFVRKGEVPARYQFLAVRDKRGVLRGALKRLAPGRQVTEQWRNSSLQITGCKFQASAPTTDCKQTPAQLAKTDIYADPGLPGVTRIRLSYATQTETFVFGLADIKSAYTGPGAADFNCPFLQNPHAAPQDLFWRDPNTGVAWLVKPLAPQKLLDLKVGSPESVEVFHLSHQYPTAYVYCSKIQYPLGGTCGSDVSMVVFVYIRRVQ